MASTKKYHITITDNENGKVYVDRDSEAIMASLKYDEDEIQGVSYLYGANSKTVLAVLKSLDEIKENLLEDEPVLGLLYRLFADKKVFEKDEE